MNYFISTYIVRFCFCPFSINIPVHYPEVFFVGIFGLLSFFFFLFFFLIIWDLGFVVLFRLPCWSCPVQCPFSFFPFSFPFILLFSRGLFNPGCLTGFTTVHKFLILFFYLWEGIVNWEAS